MRKAVWLPLLLAVLFVVVPVEAQTPLVAEVIPAPVGYVFAFSSPYPRFVYGYRNPVGTYTSYRARIGETGLYVVRVEDPRTVATIVHTEGASPLRVVETMPMLKVYGFDFEAREDMIIFGQGLVYLSQYDIAYGNVYTGTHLTVVVNEHAVDLNVTAIKVLAITGEGYVTVYPPKGLARTVRLSDLIDVPEACVAWFRDPPPGFPWVGGIIISPACVKNIEILKTAEYAGRLFAVVFRIPRVPRFGGRVEYVVMGYPSARVLSETGLVLRAKVAYPELHIITGYNLENMNVYIATSETSKLIKGEVLAVKDMTQIIKQDRGIPKRVCSIPTRATVVYKLLWSNKEISGTVELLPGEVVLYKYEGSYYVCMGDMTWVDKGDPPITRGPVYQEFLHPITIYAPSGLPVLVVTSNGKVFYEPRVEIPFNLYADNVITWYSGRFRGSVELVLTSIFTSAFFAILLIIVTVVVGIVVFGRGKAPPEKITIIWDVKAPPPLSLADKDIVEQTVKKHVEAFGVCPDIVDLALYYEVLPPIPPSVRADDEVILCPFKTNSKTESVLRGITFVLQTVLWGIRRPWKNRGYFYTLFGDEMLYIYFYKQEDEEKPEYILANALESVARSASFETTYFRRPLGLVIIVEPGMLSLVKRELSTLEELSAVPSEEEGAKPRTYNVRGYLSSRSISTSINVERIQETIDREVPRILVVSSSNIDELLEYLSEKSAMKGNDYMTRGLSEEI